MSLPTPLRFALAATIGVLAACGEDGTGPARPIGGTWSLEGVYSELDYEARCRLSGEITIATVVGRRSTAGGIRTFCSV